MSDTHADNHAETITFGPFCLAPTRRSLTRNGEPVAIVGRALDILIYLARRPGVVVDRDAIVQSVWRGRVVEANNLSVQMAALRQAIGDGQHGQSIIRTVVGRGYVFVVPPNQSPPARPSRQPDLAAFGPRLPIPATPLIGREVECDEIASKLAVHRLVSITAAGGMGKTRIALHMAVALADHYPDGVWFADLSVLASPDLVADAVANALHVGGGERPAAERLSAYLAGRRALLVLDNCEHVVATVAALVETLLATCSELSILTTSRERLSVPGEAAVWLPPLRFPTEVDGLDTVSALRHDAVALFVARATTVVPGFVFDDAAAQAIARICASVEGIALAIEMAVPRLRVLSPAQLADRLADDLRLPANPTRGTPSRHRTLRAMIDWSYDLLSDEERALLRHLSLFSGGADLAAIQAIAGSDGALESDVLDRLVSLADKSLLVTDAASQRRFRLLEPIRHYAGEKRIAAGDPNGHRRHAEYFATLFEAAEASWPTTPTNTWLARYAPDTDNLRAALAWAFGRDGDTGIGVRLVAASYPLWWDLPQMPVPEGRGWFDRALPFVDDSIQTTVAARFWLGASWRDMRYNDRESLPAAQRAVALFRQTGDAMGLGGALWRLGATMFSGRNAAETLELCTEAQRRLRPAGASKWLVMALIRAADTSMFQRRSHDAVPLYEEARAMAQGLDHWYGRLVSTTNMAEALFDIGERDRAIVLLQEGRFELSPRRRGPLLAPLVSHLLMASRVDEMLVVAREAIAHASVIGLRSALAWVTEALALRLAECGDIEDAARFAGFARHVHPASAGRVGARRAILLRLQRSLRARLSPMQRVRLAAQGAAWTDTYTIEQTMRVCALMETARINMPAD